MKKLTHEQIQQIRDLHRAGFKNGSIGHVFGVCARTVSNILHHRQWAHVQDTFQPPPILAHDAASRLRLRKTRKLTASQRAALDAYRQQLAAHFESAAEREGHAVSLLSDWTRRERKYGRRDRTTPTGPQSGVYGGEKARTEGQ